MASTNGGHCLPVRTSRPCSSENAAPGISRSHSGKAERFTPSQERALGTDPRLFFIFFSLLNGWPPEECERELRISHQTMQGELQMLARLGLIDLLSGGRIRVLTTRMVSWRKDGPVAKHFEARQSFVSLDNADDECGACSTSPETTVPLHEPQAPFLQP